MLRSTVVLLLCLAAGALLLAGDAPERNAGKRADRSARNTVEVFAAASTSNAMERIVAAFQQQEAASVRVNSASSSTLAQQITHGAPTDVFLSANQKWADFVEADDRAAERVVLLGNRLVVIVPATSSLRLQQPEDLLDEPIARLALGDPTHVPAGMYAKQALQSLGLWRRLAGRIVVGADVRQALSYVERGEAEAGIVYATDAAITHRVRVAFRIDPSATRPIRYPLVLTSRGAESPAARSLLEFLQGRTAAAIWRQHGFSRLESPGERQTAAQH
jgi:molybdate transport system substrate-binding protein